VTIYDPARDGIGYVLKVPVREHIYDGNGKRIELAVIAVDGELNPLHHLR
jgi:hypothetical protein